MANNQHFDWLAPLYDRVIRPPDAARVARVLDLPAPGLVLDAGGGTGRVASLLPEQAGVVVCDISRGMLRQAGRKGLPLAVQGSVERLPFPDGCFTRILVVDAFHHFSRQAESARELVRVLAPGGRLVIEEPDIRRFGVKLIALAETLALMNSRFRSPEWLRALLAGHGLAARVETEEATAWIIADKGPGLA
jgi:demethylmenaquinone methyltransferase/2-methoxy-6-polyprenyl-1,4-benzoquinol methylase